MIKIERRDFIKKAVAGGIGTILSSNAIAQHAQFISTDAKKIQRSQGAKKVIVAGAGISGLACAYELMKKGHEVVVLEASGRYGGAVLSVHDGLSDGLYADFGAENFTKPGYENYWKYIEEFNLPVLPYLHRENRMTRIDGKWHTDQMQREAREKRAMELGGFNKRELKFLASNPLS